jgi:serine/threonine-protein kinase
MVRSACLVAPLALLLAAPRIAYAGDPAAAQTLFDEARQLMTQGQYAQACPKLQESQDMDPGLGTQFHLADCLQHLGRSASAWALFREVESQAHALGQEGRERVARDRATALEPFLSRLTIAPQSAAANAQIELRRDGVAIGRSEWDLPVPVDPGAHVVTLLAPNKRPWETRVEVASDGRAVRVDLPPLSDLPDVQAPPPAPPQAPAFVPAAPPATPAPRPQSFVPHPMPQAETVLEDHGGFQRALGWFFVGAAAVGVGVGAYFGLQWLDDNSVMQAHCHGTCDALGAAATDNARHDAKSGEMAAGVGGAALLAGTVLVLTAPGPRLVVNNAAIDVAPMMPPAAGHAQGANRGGIVVRGVW